MSIRSNYEITFQKFTSAFGTISYHAVTNNIPNGSIAYYLTRSNLIETQSQITDINDIVNRYQNSLPFDEFWGDVANSQLYVYPDTGNVELGNTIILISDFLALLQEWENFINS